MLLLPPSSSSRLLLSCSVLLLITNCVAHFDGPSLLSAFVCPPALADHLQPAVEHEHTLHANKESIPFVLVCSTYAQFPLLQASVPAGSVYHPVLHSLTKNKSCVIMSGKTAASTTFHFNKAKQTMESALVLTQSTIPHVLKYHESIDLSIDAIIEGSASITLEVSIGLGISGKGFDAADAHKLVQTLFQKATDLLKDKDVAMDHWNKFYWTSDAVRRAVMTSESITTTPSSSTNSDNVRAREHKYRKSSSRAIACDYQSFLTVSVSQSYIAFSTRSQENHGDAPECLRILATVAVLQPSVSHVSAHLGAYVTSLTDTQQKEALSSISYSDPAAEPATDQNSWVQSGTTDQTPYSAIGVDGTGYVLGMIDTGVDDQSCFFIDSSGTITTRTPADEYMNPTTEPFRRKVIQYITWGDGEPSREYDHGTWCAGASLGNCLNATSPATAYNGIAYNAKITMFDVDISSTENYLNVPSLHNVALPPAYGAGARVHSNSWTTYYMSSYTSKSLDVDEFMFENPDFLFIAGAGNSGSEGFNSVTSPAVSKSALTVGASSVDHNDVVGFSSLGSAYDSAFKPNIVTPGRYLMSAGVRNVNETTSCNVQDSSGTSMATPIAAGASILIRHYMENRSFYGTYCNEQYRSCPIVVPSASDPSEGTFISGALLKALITSSAQNMHKYESCEGCAIPETNFSSPPDNIQGWGQVQLNHVLPIPDLYDFDLYVADYETLSSLTRRAYFVQVASSGVPLRATIAWTDPPNILWAVKNLLNDLDIMVIAPSGAVSYGNNIPGDEFNTVERVVIETPEVGEYIVYVTAKVLALGENQAYGIVITCDGSVDEPRTSTAEITVADLVRSAADEACPPSTQLIRFQLEDWNEGKAWENMTLAIVSNTEGGGSQYECTFPSNTDNSLAVFTRMHQCATCLPTDVGYTASLVVEGGGSGDVPLVARAVSPQCNVYLSSYQTSGQLMLSGSDACNACPTGSSQVMVGMYANVTDDDESQYSWYGLAVYRISSKSSSGTEVMAGTMVVSDEQADRYCLPDGTYTIALNDTLLVETHHKHAMVIVTSEASGQNVTLSGSSTVTLEVSSGTVTPSGEGDDDDSTETLVVALAAGGGALGLVGIAVGVWYFRASLGCVPSSKAENDLDKPLV